MAKSHIYDSISFFRWQNTRAKAELNWFKSYKKLRLQTFIDLKAYESFSFATGETTPK